MEVIAFMIVVVIILGVIFLNGYFNERALKKKYQDRLRMNYGKKEPERSYQDGEFEHIKGYAGKHKSSFSLDEITWNDLNMDDVFKRINYAKTSAGEEYLYYLLKNPVTKENDYKDFEDKVEYFRSHEKERLRLQILLHEMGYTGKYSIYDYLNHLDILQGQSCKKDILIDLLFIPAIAMMWFHIGIGIAALFLLILYNLVTYFKKKAVIDPYITCFSYVFRVLKEAEKICALKMEIIDKEEKMLKEQKDKFSSFKRFSYLLMSGSRMSGNPMEIVMDYARMFFHLDIIKFYSMREQIFKNWEHLDAIITIIGQLDAYLCIGEYRTHLGHFCIPQFEKRTYRAKALYHPLLTNPVKNDLNVTRSILITGSNASGKSTMLKTIALNAILAQTIHTAAADSYCADYYKIYTSLSLKDNIFEGDSFYMSEIKSIKRILDASDKDQTPILCFVDEVLRGTNTIERIAASGIILQELARHRGFCFAATHDVELTDILKNYYENMHFEETLQDGDIHFAYRLCKGKALSRNAIRLLEIMGYGNGITTHAEAMAEGFEKSGIWEALS